MAIRNRGGRCAPGLLLNAEHGVQLSAHRIPDTMSYRVNCYDNSPTEVFFSTLKLELVYGHDVQDHARRAVFEWIEAFYNRHCRHSSIGNLSSVDFENQKNSEPTRCATSPLFSG